MGREYGIHVPRKQMCEPFERRRKSSQREGGSPGKAVGKGDASQQIRMTSWEEEGKKEVVFEYKRSDYKQNTYMHV